MARARSTNSDRPPRKLGEYELLRRIAIGGMAEVYEALLVGPRGFSKRFALKRILPQLAEDERLVRMFCDEARLQAALSHPNLVQVVDFGEAGGELYIVMEFVDGLSCADLLSAVQARRRSVELGPALHIAREVLSGLSYAHTVCDAAGAPLRLVHRDVAPNNILLDRSGRVKLADFGIVRCAASDVRTAPGEIRGKIGYVSPEQALGRPVDGRSDLFSLGVVLAEMLIGEPLFAGDRDVEILSALHAVDLRRLDERGAHIPRGVHAVLRRALARDPEHRYLTARHFAADLDAAIREHTRPLGCYELAAWLADLGLVALKSDVQARSPLTPEPVIRVGGAEFPERVTLPAPPATLVPPAAADVEPAASYRLRRPGATLVGPLALARVLEMIATARAGLDTEVSRSGGPFMPLGSCFELARLAARPEYRFFEPIALLAAERHAIVRGALAAHVLRWALERRTGLVVARSTRAQERVYLVDGVPSATSSTDPNELLGANLLAGGLLLPDQLESAVEQGHRAGHPLGQALIGAGLLKPSALLGAIKLQRLRRLASLLRFAEGELFFVDQVRASSEPLAVPISACECIAEAVRLAYGEAELRALLAELWDRQLARSPEYARVCTALALRREEAQSLEWSARGVPCRAILREAALRGALAELDALRGVFLGVASGALLV